MNEFTMLAFDGLKRKRSRKSRGLGRIRRGAKRGMQEVCGCQLVQIKRKGGGTQPAIKCPGSPMPRFVKRGDAHKYHGKFCAKVLKPIGR